MAAHAPAMSIGLPVYNGEAFLPAALASLLAQDHGDFELIISDNASTDGTRDICEQHVRRDPRIRYVRNERNLGVMANFLRVPELATAPFFMWAAHDDTWSPSYISTLLGGFRASADVVLSAGRTQYVSTTGERDPMPPNVAPPRSIIAKRELATLLLRQHATSWFYGIYRRAVLPDLLARLGRLPVWGGDVLFLLHCCLNHDVVGSDDAIIYKLHKPSSHSPRTPRQRARWQLRFTTHLLRVVATADVPWQDKWALRDELRAYLSRIVFYSGPRRIARQWAKAVVAVARGQE